MAEPDRRDGAPPTHIHVGDTQKKTNWLAWLLLALGVIALLFALSRCGRDERAAVAPAAAPVAEPVAPAATPAPAAAATTGTSGLGAYITGTGALPRTFVFERLNFDTANSTVRDADRDELNAMAQTLTQHPTVRVRIVGYADARGANAANAALGKARADSVKASLVSSGVDANRIETASGGENDPVNTNATAAGQAENRRTELILLQR